MICQSCGNIMGENEKFCANCGWQAENPKTYATAGPEIPLSGHDTGRGSAQGAAVNTIGATPTALFFFLDILFATPVLGLILVIIFSCGASSDRSLTNFARARLIKRILLCILFVILAAVLASAWEEVIDMFESYIYM